MAVTPTRRSIVAHSSNAAHRPGLSGHCLRGAPMKVTKRIKLFVSKQSNRANAFLRRHSSLFRHSSSPMENFPQELVCQIFRFATMNTSSADLSTLFAITATCKRWRDTSLDDGQLWSRIDLTLPNLTRDLSRAVAFLLRSKTYSLTIHLDMRDPYWDWDEDNHKFMWQDMEAIMRMLVVHVHRWRSFELLTDTWSPIFTFLWYTRRVQDMPLMESLSLSRCNMFLAGQAFQPVPLREPVDLFGGAWSPRMRSVSLVGTHISWTSISLHDLTRLELKYIASDVAPTFSELRNILVQCPNLYHLALHGYVPQILHEGTVATEDPISLPNLESLSLGFLTPSDVTQLLSHFAHPQLSDLLLDDISAVLTPDSINDSTPLIQDLIDRQHFRYHDLQALQLVGIRCQERVLMSFLAELHSLSSLSLFNVPNDILQGLNLHRGSQHTGEGLICQALRELHCQDADPHLLMQVVRSRTGHPGIQQLQHVTLEYACLPAPGFFSPLHKQLSELGVSVVHRMTRASQFNPIASTSI